MKKNWCCKNIHVDPQVAVSLALSQYDLATPEIRVLMRNVLGHALSARTIKRLVRSSGNRLRRGRPPTTPRVHKRDFHDLIEVTSNGLSVSGANTLHFLHQIHLQFGLTPRQYLTWVIESVRRGKCVMRNCLFCGDLFPSTGSGERHCKRCRPTRRHLVQEEGRSIFL
jgi:hypothetical protein